MNTQDLLADKQRLAGYIKKSLANIAVFKAQKQSDPSNAQMYDEMMSLERRLIAQFMEEIRD